MPSELPRSPRAGDARPMPAAPVIPQLAGLPLAYGDLLPDDARELNALKNFIEGMGGFVCTGYKERCLRRRIAVRMRARGAHRYGDYETLLRRDPTEYQRLLDTVTINVSKFYRNIEVWRTLEQMVLPLLFALDDRAVRIWSAGCAGGEEPYTLAILLHEYAERNGLLSRLDRFRILATDIDRESLAGAARGEYGDFALTEAPPGMRERWFEGPQHTILRADVRRRVEFGVLDLMRDPLPEQQHLIVCRNVIIYFEREIQEQLFVRFHQALVPGGHLLLGKVETLFGAAASAFRPIANRERIFRKT